MPQTLLGANVPFRFNNSTVITAVNVVFTNIPPTQTIKQTYAAVEEISGIAVEPLSDKFPNLAVMRGIDIGEGLQPEVFKLEYGLNWVRFPGLTTKGIELWFRPGAICDVTIHYLGE